MSEPTGRPPNRLHRAARVLPAVTVDCSSWPRSEGARSRGTLMSAARHLPPAVGRWLEIRVQFTADADLRVVEALTVKLIRAAAAAAPELGLTYDPTRSRADGEDVIVALSPTNPTGAEGRLAEIVRAVEGVLVEQGVGVSGAADVQWCTAA